MGRGDGNLDGKMLFLKSDSREIIGGPTKQNTPRSSRRGAIIKIIKSSWSKFPNKGKIKFFSFGFLQTKNVCITLINFLSKTNTFRTGFGGIS
jgi:hypothetical protein